MNFKSSFLSELNWRGFINDSTGIEKIDEYLASNNRYFYIGFDCTAKSLHVGSLMQIMIMRIAQKHGHKPIVLLGGATTKIGDPSGKDKSRKILTEEEISQNLNGIKKTLEKFLNPQNIIYLNNNDWLSDIRYVDFLRDYGSKFSINRMIGFESIKSRLTRQQQLTFLEFNYIIMQGYDFLQLSRKYDCKLQIGGSDQWGNIINGVELAKKCDSIDIFGLTTPLLTNNYGKKMGKTENGAIWLDQEMFSSYDYWQYFRNTEDKDVEKFLYLLSDFSKNDIENLLKLDINEVKKNLANNVTEICHGSDNANMAERIAQNLFENKTMNFDMPKIILYKDLNIIDFLIDNNISESRSEAKKLIKGNAIKIENITIDINCFIEVRNLPISISIGKKKKFLIIRE